MHVTLDLVNGCVLGIEHLDYSDMEEVSLHYAVVVHILCFRIIFSKDKEEDE